MKKLYRIPEQGKLAGMCAGIADAYNLDVTVVRLAAVFLTALTMFWPGIITYVIGWWLVPQKTEKPEAGADTGV